MEAPDKIYLYREQSKDYFEEGWHELLASDVENIEYIRKDALIEWFNDNIKPLNVLFGEIFIARVKDKLNSM